VGGDGKQGMNSDGLTIRLSVEICATLLVGELRASVTFLKE